jgi:hypothetical protein
MSSLIPRHFVLLNGRLHATLNGLTLNHSGSSVSLSLLEPLDHGGCGHLIVFPATGIVQGQQLLHSHISSANIQLQDQDQSNHGSQFIRGVDNLYMNAYNHNIMHMALHET